MLVIGLQHTHTVQSVCDPQKEMATFTSLGQTYFKCLDEIDRHASYFFKNIYIYIRVYIYIVIHIYIYTYFHDILATSFTFFKIRWLYWFHRMILLKFSCGYQVKMRKDLCETIAKVSRCMENVRRRFEDTMYIISLFVYCICLSMCMHI